jgi:hypothetical protein
LNKENKMKTYRVVLTYCVTSPEKRGPTYAPVAAGTRYKIVFEHASQATAVAAFERAVAGQENFSSEVVVEAEVLQVRTNASPRRVRRPKKVEAVA